MALGQNYVTTIIKRSILLISIAIIFTFVVFKNPKPYVLGILVGGIINISAFKLLELSTKKILKMNEVRAKIFTSINYFIRFILYGIVLIIAVKFKEVDFISTIIALFTVKIIIITDSIYDTFKRT